MNKVSVGNFKIGEGEPFCLIAGPCLLESKDLCRKVADELCRLKAAKKINVIFKASYEKDNRGSISGDRGPGIDNGLKILADIRKEFGLPVVSDVHRENDLRAAAEVLDVVQIPAYLCQQTGLVLEAAKLAKALNIKKGQFLAPENMDGVVSKVRSVGNQNLLLTERGSSFGYNRLVSDMRSIPIMRSLGCPVIFDAGHIVRIYGIPSKDPRGGEPQFIPVLTRAGMAAGADGLFVETHPSPAQGLCDAASMFPLKDLEGLVDQAIGIHQLVRHWL